MKACDFCFSSRITQVESAIVFPPDLPPPITRKKGERATIRVHLSSEVKLANISAKYLYNTWTFNGKVPGPFIRARVGDTLEVCLLFLQLR